MDNLMRELNEEFQTYEQALADLTGKPFQGVPPTVAGCDCQYCNLIKERDDLREQVKQFKEVCVARRKIAIMLAAEVSYEEWSAGPGHVKYEILKLINITQEEHDKLVTKYHLRTITGKIRDGQ